MEVGSSQRTLSVLDVSFLAVLQAIYDWQQ